MSETPRTDAFIKEHGGPLGGVYLILTEFARQLERELRRCAAAHMVRELNAAPQVPGDREASGNIPIASSPVDAALRDRRDAQRYRWLKEQWSTGHGSHHVEWSFGIGCAEVYDLEPMIDKAMAKDDTGVAMHNPQTGYGSATSAGATLNSAFVVRHCFDGDACRQDCDAMERCRRKIK